MRFLYLFRIQLRQVFSLRLCLAMLLFPLLHLASVAGDWDPHRGSACYYFSLSVGSGVAHLTFYILPVLPFAMSLSQEWESHAVPYWVVRGGTARYTVSKLLASAISGFLVIGLGSLLLVLCSRMAAPAFWNPGDAPEQYEQLFLTGNQFLGWLLLITHYALSGALVAMVGMFASIVFRSSYAAAAAPICAVFLLSRLLSDVVRDVNSIFWPFTWVTAIHLAETPWQTIAEKLVLVLVLGAVVCLSGVSCMKRRVRRA